ncbi:MAG: flavin reductase family protein [Bacilli bacterium]|jgi:flavin reductase (DIM6/NTAB) family NADH-FMN oxidoreductase RutF|nr:flavin reductase family protein [Bacilli bacterium]MCH4236310.1 flavin reductase family protein [Bacilli bacterium]
MKAIKPQDILFKPIKAIGRDYFLINTDVGEQNNTMTAAWGQIGLLWNKPIFTIYVRPSRYTKKLLDQSEYFVISFLPSGHPAYEYLGTISGYEERNKVEKSQLKVVPLEHGFTFEEAYLTLVCKKIYVSAVKKENFLESKIPSTNYPKDDFSLQYIGEIVLAYSNEEN